MYKAVARLLMTKAQYRLIDGALYKREPQPYCYDFIVHDLGHGQAEALSMPRYAWAEVDATAEAIEQAMMAQTHIRVDGEWVAYTPTRQELLDKAAKNRGRSAKRAKTKVRRLVKAKNLDTMLTLTYRENMTDRSRMARDFDVFVKRLRRALPSFEYVCVFERQKRGAWHAHLAVQRVQSHYLVKGVLVKSYDLLRAVWRAVVGEGNVDVSRSIRHGQRKPGKLAAYLSKYISKGFEDGQEGNSYRASGAALPKPVVMRSLASDGKAAAEELWGLLRSFWPGAEFHGAWLDAGGYYLSLSP